jgi:hypothetical protein
MAMTEAEWLACEDPVARAYLASPDQNDRKLRLFACACCRQLGTIIDDSNMALALLIAERFADREVSNAERIDAYKAVDRIAGSRDSDGKYINPDWLRAAMVSVRSALGFRNPKAAENTSSHVINCLLMKSGEIDKPEYRIAIDRELLVQSFFVKDIFGNPFRPVVFDPVWRTSTALAIAQGIYDDRAFDRLPILADALQDAGCENDDILNHLRGDGPHVKGCWALDLVLGKE